MDDIDLSRLLPDVETPSNGAARARHTVAKRRKRQQFAGASLAVLTVLGIGGGVIARMNDGNDVMLQRETGVVTTTAVPDSTTTTIGSEKSYIGLTHTSAGSGLPVNASILFGGGRSNGEPRIGEFAYFWVRDDQRDMVWADRITAFDTRTGTITGRVMAVFAVDPLDVGETACMATCIDTSTGQRDPSAVAVFRDAEIVRAWTLGPNNRDLIPTNRRDLAIGTDAPAPKPSPTTAAPAPIGYPTPNRPELYGIVAQCKGDACPWYDTNEQVEVRGGAGPEPALNVSILLDRKDNKNVLVWTDGSVVRDTLVVNANAGQLLPPTSRHTYKGTPVNNLVYLGSSDNVRRAWLMDQGTQKFTEVSAADVSTAK